MKVLVFDHDTATDKLSWSADTFFKSLRLGVKHRKQDVPQQKIAQLSGSTRSVIYCILLQVFVKISSLSTLQQTS